MENTHLPSERDGEGDRTKRSMIKSKIKHQYRDLEKEKAEMIEKVRNMTLYMAPEDYDGATIRSNGTYRSSLHTSINGTYRQPESSRKHTSRSTYTNRTNRGDEYGEKSNRHTNRKTGGLATKWDTLPTTRKITSARIRELQALEQVHLQKLEAIKEEKAKDRQISYHYKSTPRGYGTYELLRIDDNKFRSLKDKDQIDDRSYFLHRRIMGGLHAPIPFKTTTQAMYPEWEKKHYPRRARDDPSNFNRKDGQFSKFVDICVGQGVDYRSVIPLKATSKS